MSLAPRSWFAGGDERAYLYTAGEGLMPLAAHDAMRRYVEHKARGAAGRAENARVERACRDGLARLMGAEAGDVALLGSASEGINAIYGLVDWQPGDNVVVPTSDLEFPSVVLPAARLARRGVEVRVVERDGWIIAPERIAAAVDRRTRLVFLSHVSYRTGYRFDLEALTRLLDGSGALLAVDATQSLGVVPVPSGACDYLVATTQKWLLGPHGLGVFYWNRRRWPLVEPSGIGWYSVVDDLHAPYELKPDAGRFELGGLNWLGLYALEQGLRILLDLGVERVEQHVLDLGTRLLDGLAALGMDVMTPRDPRLRAGIVSWIDPRYTETADALAERGVLVTGSAGRVRAAMHIYNDATDVERSLAELARHA
jgi:selenocysteine lyase/cysteine desulfurase